MSSILSGYLAREIFKTSIATMLVLYIIFISNALGRVLADVADGDTPLLAIWAVMLSQSINILSLLLPVSVFLGIIFTFGRMYKDHEIVVMSACGIGYREFYKPVVTVVVPMFLLSCYVSLSLNGQMQGYAMAVIDTGLNQHQFHQVKTGKFNQSGDTVFYMDSLSEDKLQLRDVILGQSNAQGMIIESAQSGYQKFDELSGDLFLVVGPGQRVEGIAGQKDFKIIDYEQHGILLQKKVKPISQRIHSIEKSLVALWASERLSDRVELHWRIATPMILLTLAILAVPLSYISPRQGRFGKVGYALLTYVVYFNLIAVTRAQIEAGSLPVVVNFWWVHLFFITIAGVLIYRRNNGVLFSRAIS